MQNFFTLSERVRCPKSARAVCSFSALVFLILCLVPVALATDKDVLFYGDFETGDTSQFDVHIGGSIISASSAAHGSYAYNLSGAGNVIAKYLGANYVGITVEWFYKAPDTNGDGVYTYGRSTGNYDYSDMRHVAVFGYPTNNYTTHDGSNWVAMKKYPTTSWIPVRVFINASYSREVVWWNNAIIRAAGAHMETANVGSFVFNGRSGNSKTFGIDDVVIWQGKVVPCTESWTYKYVNSSCQENDSYYSQKIYNDTNQCLWNAYHYVALDESNGTISEFECDWCVENWTEDYINSTCYSNNTYWSQLNYFDNAGCNQTNDLPENNGTVNWFECVYCNESWAGHFDNTSCFLNDTRHQFLTYYDVNGCNRTEPDNPPPLDNGTLYEMPCNFCTEDIQNYIGPWSTCTTNATEEQVVYFLDLNFASCCNMTNLTTDCHINNGSYGNVTNSKSCGWFATGSDAQTFFVLGLLAFVCFMLVFSEIKGDIIFLRWLTFCFMLVVGLVLFDYFVLFAAAWFLFALVYLMRVIYLTAGW